MRKHGSLPRARQDGLLEEAVGEELLLYDRESHTAHCLSPLAACVWRHCDGARDLAEVAVVSGVSEDLVADALHELREKDLLDAEPELTQSAVPGESRREAIGRVARYGAAAAAGSMIVSATATTPAMASSGELEEIKGKGLMCEGPAIGNCCVCTECCIFGHVAGAPSKAECEDDRCKGICGEFVSWNANMTCKHP
jgi:hypothetical protein